MKVMFLKLGAAGLGAGLALAQNSATDSQSKLIQVEREKIAELRAQEELAKHPPPLSPETEARLRESLRAKIAELNAPIPAPAPAPVATEPAAKTARERLAELTELYKANKISPGEYHKARAQLVSQL